MHKGFTVYPLTIIKDRYGGAYSGSEYTAWNLDFYEIPIDITLSDISCMEFWGDEEIKQKYIIGKGRTAEEAVDDLYLKLEMPPLKRGKNEKEIKPMDFDILKECCAELGVKLVPATSSDYILLTDEHGNEIRITADGDNLIKEME